MAKIDPKHAAEISKGLADYSKTIHSKPLHPTQTTKGSVWIDHADGTTSHWQVRRPKTQAEVRRAQRRATVEAGRRVQAGVWFRLRRALVRMNYLTDKIASQRQRMLGVSKDRKQP